MLNIKIVKIIKNFSLDFCTFFNSYFVKNNRKKVLKKLIKTTKTRKLRVAFFCYSKEKWKCQSLFDLMEKSEFFEPFIFLSAKNPPNNAICEENSEHIKNNINFFKNKNMDFVIGYDFKKNKFIPIQNFKPDIIFYTDPWYCPKNQAPSTASKFALTYYVPYYVPNISNDMEYGLRFHRLVQKYYVLNDTIKNYYAPKMKNKGENLSALGHPQLDYFYLNKNQNHDKKYVIFAPHWSINYKRENYATFEWSGKWILNYAQNHPEINWLFKPHPTLKSRLLSQKIMTEKEIKAYWQAWMDIGICYESGDYLDYFVQSYLMITDCGSFLTEYFLTKNPLIHLVSKKAYGYNPNAQMILENCYSAENTEELNKLLNQLIFEKQDFMKEKRLECLEKSGLLKNYAALNIINDIKNDLKLN